MEARKKIKLTELVMSFSAFIRVAKLRGLTAPQKLVMCCLSDFADDNGIAYPSIELISEWSGLNRKTVMKTVRELSEIGLIESRKTFGAKSIYRLAYAHIESSTKNGSSAEFGTSTKNGHEPVPKTDMNQYQNWDTNQSRTSQEPDIGNFCVSEPSREKEKPAKKSRSVSVPKPEEVTQESWNAWMQVRKNKKASTLNSIAWARFKSEAQKAGLTLQEAVTICAEKEWRGFEAAWLKNDKALHEAPTPTAPVIRNRSVFGG